MAKVTYVSSNALLDNVECAVPLFNTGLQNWQPTSGQDQGTTTIRNPGTFSRFFVYKTVGGSVQRMNLELPYSTEYITFNPTANTLSEDNSSTQALADETSYTIRDNATTNRNTRFVGFTFEPDSGLHFTAVGFYGAANSTANSETRYWPGQGQLSSNTTDITAYLLPNDITVTAKNFWAKVYTNTRITNTTLRFRKNQANGNGVIVVAAGVTGIIVDATNTDSLTAGDEFNYSRATGTGGGSFALAQMGVELHSSAVQHHMYGMEGTGADRPLVDSTTLKYFVPFGGLGPLTTTEAETKIPMGHAGTFSKFRIKVAASTTTNDATLTIRKNGTDMITIPITAATNATFSDITNNFTFAIGDLISASIKLDSGTGSFQIVMMSMVVSQGATEVDVTKSLKYTIKKAIGITKTLVYKVRAKVGITKTLRYFIDREQDITKTLKYTIKKAVGLTKSLRYAVKVEATSITKSLKYTTRAKVDVTKSLAYKVRAKVDITKSLKYTVDTEQSITKTLKYTIKGKVDITKSLTYHITSVTNDLAQTMTDNFDDNSLDTGKWVDNTLGIGVEAAEKFTFEYPGSVADTYSLDSVERYSLLDSYAYIRVQDYGANDTTEKVFRLENDSGKYIEWRQINKDAFYIVNDGTGASTLGSRESGAFWLRIRYEVSTDKLFWEYCAGEDLINEGWQIAYQYDDFSFTLPDIDLEDFTIRNFIQTDGSTGASNYSIDNYNIFTRKVDTPLSLRYTIRKANAVTKSLRYAVRVKTDTTKSLRYAVRAKVDITKQLRYVVDTEQQITKSLKYTITGKVGITKSLTYHVHKANAVTKSLQYAVRVPVAITKSLQYAVRVPTGILKTLRYAVYTKGVITKSLTYVVSAEAAITKSLRYAVRSPHGITKSLTYHVIPNRVYPYTRKETSPYSRKTGVYTRKSNPPYTPWPR